MLFALSLLSASRQARAAGIAFVGRADGATGVAAVAMSPDGSSVYAAAPGVDAVLVFARDAASGLLTQVQRISGVLGAQGVHSVRGIAVSPDGKSVYLTTRSPLASGAQGISVFARDTGTGLLTFLEIQREGVGGVSGLYDPRAVVVSGDGLNVYARSRSALATFARNATTGALTFVGAEAYDTVISAGSGGIVVSPDGAQLYTVDDKVVLMYARAPGTGVLSFLGTVENGVDGVSGINTPRNLAISPDGQNVYVVSLGTFGPSNDDFTVLARDPGTGALTYVEKHHESRPLRRVNSAAVAPTGQRTYFTSAFIGDAAVGFYQRDSGTGALTLGGSLGHKDFDPDPIGIESPTALVVSPDNAHVYVADAGSNGILIFDVRCGTGTLDPGEGCDDGNNDSHDGCSSSCDVESCFACAGAPSVCTPDDGTACDDGTICTVADICTGGYCFGTPNDGIACNDGDVCTVNDTCLGGGCFGSFEAEVGCRQPIVPGGSRLKMKQSDGDVPESEMDWKWGHGQATSVADFGDPRSGTTNYTACVYEQTGPVAHLDAGPGCSASSCWKQTGKGFRLRSSTGPIRRLSLKAGAEGKAAIDVVATNALPVPGLPLTPPVTIQLKAWHFALPGQATVDACWAATFSTPAQNDAKKLKARSD
jgi:cysteine-rich repeat protein